LGPCAIAVSGALVLTFDNLGEATELERGGLSSGARVGEHPSVTEALPWLLGVLDELGLKTDREGNPRTAYSLRHTYICLRLMEGADIYQIAKNCRTSVEMIEKYYASHIKTSIDAAAVNIMKKRRKTKVPDHEG
jgi:integrase